MGFVYESVTVDDGDTVYPALVLDDQRWNGFLIPFFSTNVARTMGEDFAKLEQSGDEYAPRFQWLGMRLAVHQHGDSEPVAVDPQVVLHGDMARYCIGGWEWCWMRATV